MSTISRLTSEEEIEYPESDGEPMAENTLQYEWIVTIKGGLDFVFRHDPNVFVAGDLFWYPIKGDNKTRRAPDVMVALGRPKGHRRAYLQWREDNIPPQVVFEILTSSNRGAELERKFQFYETFGVEEYYIYDPDYYTLEGWLRRDQKLIEIPEMSGWVSPRLAVRFEMIDDQFRLYGPDGRPFDTMLEYAERAERNEQRAEQERLRAEEQQRRAEEERLRAERLAAQLKALGIEPDV